MTLGPALAAILAVLAAAGEPGAVPPAGAPRAPAETPAVDAGGPPGDAPPAGPAAEAPPVEPVPAPPGPALADSGAVLIDRVEYQDGWALERLLEPSGEIVEHLVNRAGTVQSCRPAGSLSSLLVIDQRPAANGEFLQVARDASGALLRFAVGTDGAPRAVALLAPPPR